MAQHVFTGFGFGPIQGGLFVKEAFQSGNFKRIVVSEIDQKLVDVVRINKGSYCVNVAGANGIEVLKIDNIELLNPGVAKDRQKLVEVLSESTEITTCLPSVNYYDLGEIDSVCSLMAAGLKNSKVQATVIYTAENHNKAAEILRKAVNEKIGTVLSKRRQFLNTVIGKMSRVVTDPDEIEQLKLVTITPDIQRAFLVEKFNRILVSRVKIPDFEPGIKVFLEKDELLAFEEAKLYGHNAIHALLAYLGALKGYSKMTELKHDSRIMKIASDAFINESGSALIKKYGHLGDELFTNEGYKSYAEDLLERMTNPYLADTVERAGRDPVRKLRVDDRIFGTMALALEYGIEPINMALGAMAGIAVLLENAVEYNLPRGLCRRDWHKLNGADIEKIINWIWSRQKVKYPEQIIKYTKGAHKHLKDLING